MNWLQRTIEASTFPYLLTGFRIVMRPPTIADWPEWKNVRRENREFLKPYEPAWDAYALTKGYFERQVTQQIKERKNGSRNSFLIFKKEDRSLIGGINVNNICRGSAQYATLGYWIDKNHQGQGYMAEALRLTLKHCFETLKLHRVHASCIPNNERSRNLLLRAGFKQEGFAEKYLEIDGRRQDHFLFGFVRESWKL